MEVLYPHCAGLDVPKRTGVACIAHTDGRGHVTWTTQTGETTTPDLLALQAWLVTAHVTHVAMEATGAYGKPVSNLLDGVFTTWVVNPAHIQQVPGRKTDIPEAEGIADGLRPGLLPPSVLPDRPPRELRDLTRQRTQGLAARSRAVNRVQKVLEGAHIKLSRGVTDVLGVSGRRMLEAWVTGTTDPATLAAWADPRRRATPAVLPAALTGAMGAPQHCL